MILQMIEKRHDQRGIEGLETFIGTLGILRRAAQLDLIDLPSTLARPQQTTFYIDPEVIRSLLDEDAQRRNRKAD
jgi:hypothetical protein